MNRLEGATSPYLVQHASNPVDWWPWVPEAFEEARRRDVPLLISIGYAACHWCHVMAHESFENQEVADLVNRHFVAIKVDREERPDIDSVYMTATQAMTGQGGWPMTVFATPEGEPFFCGTYYPTPAFTRLLHSVSALWRDERAAVVQKNILGLDVAMHHTALMRVLQCIGNLGRDAQGVGNRELVLALEPAPERFALHVRHHVVQQSVRTTAVKQGKDVRMLQVRGELYLLEKALRPEDRGELRMQQLDRDLAMVLQILREIHRRHPTRTKLALDGVAI